MSRSCLIWSTMAHFIRWLRIVDELSSILIDVSILSRLCYSWPPQRRWYIASLIELVVCKLLRHGSMYPPRIKITVIIGITPQQIFKVGMIVGYGCGWTHNAPW